MQSIITSINARIQELETELAVLRAAQTALQSGGKSTEYLQGAVDFARKNYSTPKRAPRRVIDADLKDAILDLSDSDIAPKEIAEILDIDVNVVYAVRRSALRQAA